MRSRDMEAGGPGRPRTLATTQAATPGGILGPALAVALAAGCVPPTPAAQFYFAEHRTQLPGNGLRAVILPDDTTDHVSVAVRYHVGDSADPEGKAGLAHLVTHLTYRQRPLLDLMRTSTTYFDASTEWDTTEYVSFGLEEDLESALQAEATRLSYGCEAITQEQLDRERERVRDEVREHAESLDGQLERLIYSQVYPASHPYHRAMTRDSDQLDRITLHDVCRFMTRYYVPGNATVIVAGDVDPTEVAELLARWFGRIPGRPVGRQATPPALSAHHARVPRAMDIDHPMLFVVWPLPPVSSPDHQAADFAASALSGWLDHHLEQWNLSRDMRVRVIGGEHAPALVVGIELTHESKRDKALEFVWKAARSAHRPYKFADFRIPNIHRRVGFVRSLESLRSRVGRMGYWVQFQNDVPWDAEALLWHRRYSDFDQLDEGHVARVVKQVLGRDRAVVIDVAASQDGVVGGGRRAGRDGHGADGQKDDDEPRQPSLWSFRGHDWQRTEVDIDEARKPVSLRPEPDPLAEARRFTLDNGMRVVLLSSQHFPVIAARLDFDLGWIEPGSVDSWRNQLAAQFLGDSELASRTPEHDFVQVFLWLLGWDRVTFQAATIDIYLEPLIESLERRVAVGTYSQDALERWWQQRSEEHHSQRSREGWLYWLLQRVLPYREMDRNMADLQRRDRGWDPGRIGRDELLAFKNRYYKAGNATLVVAGKLDLQRAEALIREHFAGWDRGEQRPAATRRPVLRRAPVYAGVVARRRSRMAMSIAYPAPTEVDEDHASRLILRHMLQIHLEDADQQSPHSYGFVAYGPYPGRNSGGYFAHGSADAGHAGASLAAMRRAIQEVREGHDGFEEDFVHARRQVLQSLRNDSITASEMADRLLTIASEDLASDFYRTLEHRVANTTPDQVRAVARNELRPERETVVCLAERDTLNQAFEDAGLPGLQLWPRPRPEK